MPNIEINQLYNHIRIPDTGYDFLCLILYFPFGIILFLLRLIVGLQVFLFGAILPDLPFLQWILSKVIGFTLGIIVHIENPDKKETVEVYVSNYISQFDHLVAHTATECVTPGKNNLSSLLSAAFGIKWFGSSLINFESFKKNIVSLIDENAVPVFFQPEHKMTNGKALLKFKTWPFNLCTKVQPICIEVSRPVLGISISALESNYWIDTFFFMFSPYTVYTLRFLPTVNKFNLSEADFAEKVRQDLATALKIEVSQYTAADLQEWEKRYISNLQRTRATPRPVGVSLQNNPEIQRMARQVKEVLPLVPVNVICKDLLRTRSVDQTITNILEGHVAYIPEPEANLSSTTPQMTPSHISQSFPSPSFVHKEGYQEPFCTAASSFGKSAQERTQSFQERKQQLIDCARRRYIKKHGLNIVALNNC